MSKDSGGQRQSGGPGRFGQRRRWEIALRYSELPGTVRAVAWAIATWLDRDMTVFRSAADLAADAGVSRRTAQRALEDLRGGKEGSGPRWLEVLVKGGDHHATVYRAVIPRDVDETVEAVLRGKRRQGDAVSAPKRQETASGATKNGVRSDQERRHPDALALSADSADPPEDAPTLRRRAVILRQRAEDEPDHELHRLALEDVQQRLRDLEKVAQ
jgi:hypothetical protein